MILVLVWLISI